MNKRILVAGLALALGGMSTATFAADGNFYVGAGVGQAKWHLSGDNSDVKFDDSDTTANVRFGYVWHWNVDFAIEGGYVDLGKYASDWHGSYLNDHLRTSNRIQGLFAGAKVKYGFGGGWYVSARGGLFQGKFKQDVVDTYDDRNGGRVTETYSIDSTKTGEYAGVGIGYDLSRQFSLGLNYDYYHNKFFDTSMHFDTVTVSAEYRF